MCIINYELYSRIVSPNIKLESKLSDLKMPSKSFEYYLRKELCSNFLSSISEEEI
jgi:hypothetical protein